MFRFQGVEWHSFGWSQRTHSVGGLEAAWLTRYLACSSCGPALFLQESYSNVCGDTAFTKTLYFGAWWPATRPVLSRECLGGV